MQQNNQICSIRPNQRGSHFTATTGSSLKIFSSNPLGLRMILSSEKIGKCVTAELLMETNIVALIPKEDEKQNKVCIFNLETEKMILSLIFKDEETVLAVRFCKLKMVIIFQERIRVFDLSASKMILFVCTDFSPAGLCGISNAGMLAYPIKETGKIGIVDLSTLEEGKSNRIIMIKCHTHRIACLAVSNNGHLVGTASEEGTVIRIHSISQRKVLQELRRGCDPACIRSMAFSPSDKLLAVSSDKGTVHIFSVLDSSKNSTSLLRPFTYVLPEAIGESVVGKALDSERSQMRFSGIDEGPHLLLFPDDHCVIAIGLDGAFLKYSITGQNRCVKKTETYFADMGDDFPVSGTR